QLLAREALLEVVAPHVLDPSLPTILLSLATARSRRMDVDLDVVRHLRDPLPSGSIPCPTWSQPSAARARPVSAGAGHSGRVQPPPLPDLLPPGVHSAPRRGGAACGSS